MESDGLFLTKNDSGWDQVQDSQWWTFSYCWGFQDLEALPRGLSTWSPYVYWPQQPLLIYGHKEFEL